MAVVVQLFEEAHFSVGLDERLAVLLQFLRESVFELRKTLRFGFGPMEPAGERLECPAGDDWQPRDGIPGFRFRGCERRVLSLNRA